MTACRRHRRRTTALATAAALLALTAAAGCSSVDRAVDRALDRVRTADAVATGVGNLQQAVSRASDDPAQTAEALDEIDEELRNLGDVTHDAGLSQAVDDLQAGVTEVRDAVEKGDTTPDVFPVADAATEIGEVCGP
ncbi:hypothetical protein OG909_10505 [Streptomyces sp. NBC_01754]|uniref:hypothetical protein n=1 Tax=Streptomyces sp. NBC_01754 TaxID=2975930 RepID=UPI002DDBE542|nr:hypothetical protein [Streptomyces sp. NBC_01754]WSC92687.1 hypothetical protein OG909_10505 [Streptomyces sp. NBC_01754]